VGRGRSTEAPTRVGVRGLLLVKTD